MKKGDFTTKFSERSPLSQPAELKVRLSMKDAPEDYDLAGHDFWVTVPENYDPATPHALVVYLNYKPTDQGPVLLKGTLAKRHILFVSAVHGSEAPISTQAGLAVDAVHNLSKMYNIDPRRVWLFGTQQPTGSVPFAYPDVFTGAFVRDLGHWRALRAGPNLGNYGPAMAAPPARLVSMAKSRGNRYVVGLASDDDAYRKLVFNALKSDGFKVALEKSLVDPDTHYPHFTVEWFERVMATLDAPPAPGAATTPTASPIAAAGKEASDARSAATKPAAAPEISAAAKQLSLARSYIAAGSYKPARTRLEAIVRDFPDDPAAAEAKTLLEQIKDKK